MIENEVNSLTNKENARIPVMTSSGQIPLGKNTITYQKLSTYRGRETTERLKRIRYNRSIDYDEKLFHDFLKIKILCSPK